MNNWNYKNDTTKRQHKDQQDQYGDNVYSTEDLQVGGRPRRTFKQATLFLQDEDDEEERGASLSPADVNKAFIRNAVGYEGICKGMETSGQDGRIGQTTLGIGVRQPKEGKVG